MDTNRIRDELYHRLSQFAYNDKHIKKFNLRFEDGKQNWSIIGEKDFLLNDEDTGFNAVIYKNNNEIVISFRGTEGDQLFGDGWKDIVADVQYVVAKDKVDKFGLNVNTAGDKINIDFHQKNQFRQSENLVAAVKEKYPNANISVTGHSLGGALASYSAAMTDVNAVTFNSPSVVELLPKEKQKQVAEGKFDKQIVNYVHPRDSISAGAFKPYERHIGSTYYIGTLYEYENTNTNAVTRFLKSISDDNYHALDHYSFDAFGNINNSILTNVLTGKVSWQSPRFFSSTVASIEVTPDDLENTAKQLDEYVSRVEDLCHDIKRSANMLDNIKRSDYIIDEVIHSAQDFNAWFTHKTLEIKHKLNSAAVAYVEADKLHGQ
ncbi:hypothetical protein M4D55_22320 [Metabacillus idriensis]|uniref:lipase family protein n=1 Tax=Metabacillus idriensis TaxID=324768 RepID=UPI0008A90B11|nr:hypothetical protein [Metabacillus idriensis]MCM3598499.1 hypothetical protein [Metabacillus idriensis]OHR74520.1 hypothetical protein HMPREF3291_17745 [Bacillus sp. HMSC76G11]